MTSGSERWRAMYPRGRCWLSASGRRREKRRETLMDVGLQAKAHQSARKVRSPPDSIQSTLQCLFEGLYRTRLQPKAGTTLPRRPAPWCLPPGGPAWPPVRWPAQAPAHLSTQYRNTRVRRCWLPVPSLIALKTSGPRTARSTY
jgi:hypothetical protein